MKTATLIFTFIFLFTLRLYAQSTFSHIYPYGDSSQNFLYNIKEFENGGYLLIGQLRDQNTSDFSTVVIKTNAAGNEELIKNFAAPDFANVFSINQDKDSNYVITGISGNARTDTLKVSTLSKGDFRVLNVDYFKIPTDSFLGKSISSVIHVPGKGWLIFGKHHNFVYHDMLYFIDKNGKVKWHFSPENENVTIFSTKGIKYFNGNYYVFGTGGDAQSTLNEFITVIDSTGKEKRYKLFLKTSNSIAVNSSLNILNDGNLLFTQSRGETTQTESVVTQLYKINPELDTIWTKTYNTSSWDNTSELSGLAMAATVPTESGGAIMLLQESNVFVEKIDYLAKLDKSGNIIWRKAIDSVYETRYFSLIETADGGIGLVGEKNNDFHFLKLNSEGTLSGISKEKIQENKLKIYPNPSENDIFIQLTNTNLTKCNVIIYDLAGKIIKNQYNLSGNPLVLQREGLKAGIYLLKLTDEQGNFYQEKLILK